MSEDGKYIYFNVMIISKNNFPYTPIEIDMKIE